uniref:Large ribosomal subunit protein bL9m n=1 Tax=Scophthalmus maximus TaxID=52904 RepID=A0A8D3C1C8_SCOMX
MWSSGRRVLQDLLSPAAVRSLSLTPAQNTVVVERWWQVPLSKVGSPPRLHPRRHRVYKLVEDTSKAPKEKMELILTQTVPKLGGRGDTVFVQKSVGRNKLLPQGLAAYPSPDNKQMFEEELRVCTAQLSFLFFSRLHITKQSLAIYHHHHLFCHLQLLKEGKPEDRVQTRTGQMTVEFLKHSQLKINKMPSEEFKLTKEVVCRQFLKKLGVVVPPHALSLPFEPIKDVGDYWCEVMVNGINTVRVPMSLVPYEDPSLKYRQELKRQKQQQEAAPTSEVADEDEALVKAVSDAAVETEAGKDSVSEAASAAEETASSRQTTQDTTSPPSDSPKKD